MIKSGFTATGLCSEFGMSRRFLLRCDVLLVLEKIGSEMNPIFIDDDDDDDDDDDEGGDGDIVNGNGGDDDDDDDSDDDFLYEWCPLDLRQFGMLRSFVQATGKEYCLFYVLTCVCVCVYYNSH